MNVLLFLLLYTTFGYYKRACDANRKRKIQLIFRNEYIKKNKKYNIYKNTYRTYKEEYKYN